jgi:MFS family permease
MSPSVDPPVLQSRRSLGDRVAELRKGLGEVLRTPPIFLAAGIEAVMYLGYGAFLGFLPIYARTAGLNDAQIAIVLGAQLILAMAAKPLAGRLSDGIGRLPVIATGLLLCAVALPLVFRSGSWTAFLLAAPILGIGVGAVTPVTNALIADIASARHLGAAMGVFGTIWDIGEAAGPIMAGFLIGSVGYAATFDVIAVLTGLVAIALVSLIRDPKRGGPR